MPPMSAERRRAFLLEGTRTAKVATVAPRDGRPHVTPIWFVLDGEDVMFTTDRTSVKGRALRHDPRISLCIDDDRPPFAFVMIDGVASISEELSELRRWATRIGGRYMGADRAEEFGARNGVPGELLVRVTPTRIIAEDGVAE